MYIFGIFQLLLDKAITILWSAEEFPRPVS